ncbi:MULTISPECIES: glucan 1,4-alpha-glucosidase [unclassified Microbispora]|uniref:glucan 1,4-alpha-glucosidase n=1 Tax=unclassified Microbispora TaxID=2614687 RepID=UPI00143B9DC1|nr:MULTISPECIES: glucan 1,4-alpha-glucosidase [unclassified Microbispora]NJP30179.1 glucan 1,4-alpha-glucosidase [Microbispora sp. CL1-1]
MRFSLATAAALTILLPQTPPAPAAAEADPPGAPGAAATWSTGDKEGVGTSATRESPVWYTLAGGALSEVYYPNGGVPNVRSLDFAVTDGSTFTQRESQNTRRSMRLTDEKSLTYQQSTEDLAGRWRLTKTYVTDPVRASVLIDVKFEILKGGPLQLYALYDPSLAGTAKGDSGRTEKGVLISEDTGVGSALASSIGFTATTTGYAGSASDGWIQLQNDHELARTYESAPQGNITQTAQLPVEGRTIRFTLALGFAATGEQALATATRSLRLPFAATAAAYASGWRSYLSALMATRLTGRLRAQYYAALMTVKAHEDKARPGAFIASLTIPWGQAVDADSTAGGYHFVWARDLYHQVSALLAAGDRQAAGDAVRWLFDAQQRADGHFPQNSKTDGTPDQNNVQLDETAFPIILAQQAGVWHPGVTQAADYLVAHGPVTPQERWEETGGYSPSTIAAEIAALVCAADLVRRHGDPAKAAIYQAVADSWQRQVQAWTYTTTGNLSDGRYYVRINASGKPDDGAAREYANGAGVHKESSVVDAGFLELVRLGVKRADDPAVAHSLKAVDESIAVDTAAGRVWKRYTFDGYGETADGAPWTGVGVGRPWPILSGERGEYALANRKNATPYLRTMANSANDGLMIPEQIWDKPDPTAYGHVFGKGTGSAAPLAWAMAQYVRLALGIEAGRPVETPRVVADRYARTLPAPALTVTGPADMSTADGKSIEVTGTTTAGKVYIAVNGVTTTVTPSSGSFTATVRLPAVQNTITVAAVAADGGTNAVTRTVMSFGDRLGGLADPVGDDNGPGSYVYPASGAFSRGAFDLKRFDVYRDGDTLRLVTTLAGDITNPWGGNGMSVQRLNVYLQTTPGGSPQPALPGTNIATGQAWQLTVVADGRYPMGAYAPGGEKISDVGLSVLPATRQIVASLPVSALNGTDPRAVKYAVAMFSDAENGEGIGNIRPVYSLEHWQTGPWWIHDYRFGGGAGEYSDALPAKDTDTSDPNAIDVIVGAGQDQSDVLDWTKHTPPVAVPLLGLDE